MLYQLNYRACLLSISQPYVTKFNQEKFDNPGQSNKHVFHIHTKKVLNTGCKINLAVPNTGIGTGKEKKNLK